MKKLLLTLLFLVTLVGSIKYLTAKNKDSDTSVNYETKAIQNSHERIIENAKIVQKVIESNSDYNSEIAFLIDMKIPSNRNRFFIYDLKSNKVLDQGLVAHGAGSETSDPDILKFSNIENSLATSLGTYSIGNSYDGQFGKAYKMYGLEATNSNAFKRYIVLHKYTEMPYEETDKKICLSHGCPMVNEIFFNRLEKRIDDSPKKILMRIYY